MVQDKNQTERNTNMSTSFYSHGDTGTITRYQVIDSQTGYIMSEHSTSTRAHRKADKWDLIYGAVRYTVKAVTR